MRILLLTILFITGCGSKSSIHILLTNDAIYLSEFKNEELLTSLIKQGEKLFRNSKCYQNTREDFIIVPYIIATPENSIAELSFESERHLLSSLYTSRESKRGFLNFIFWEVYTLSKDKYKKQAILNSKNVNCLFDRVWMDRSLSTIGVEKIKYKFYIESTWLYITFIVAEGENIFVEIAQKERRNSLNEVETKEIKGIFKFSEFNKMYKSGEIELYSNNL